MCFIKKNYLISNLGSSWLFKNLITEWNKNLGIILLFKKDSWKGVSGDIVNQVVSQNFDDRYQNIHTKFILPHFRKLQSQQ